jgi:hypothetical protein
MILSKVRISIKSGHYYYAYQTPPPQKKKQLRQWPRVTNESDQWYHSLVTATASSGPGPPHYRGFTIATFGRTPLDESSARRRDFYLTTHNTHNRQTFMPAAGFEPAIPASKRPYSHALDRAVSVKDYSIVDYISGLHKLL